MIGLFRQLKQNLSTQGQFRKYLLYALGEILLVMIGILLALQVNNWNETRKALQVSDKVVNNLKLELEEAHKRAENTIRFNKEIISRSLLFVEDRLNMDSLKQNPGNALTWTDYAPLKLDLQIVDQETGAEGLILGNEELNSKLRAIKLEAQKLEETIFYMDELWNSQVAPFLVEKRKMIAWDRYLRKGEANFQEVMELTDDEEYRNLVAMLRLFTSSYIESLERFANSTVEALKLIKQPI